MTRLRTILVLAVVVVVCLVLLSWRAACTKAASEGKRADIAQATGTALDTVAAETTVTRAEQQEKQREVEQIPGADQRLPDGFGANLERVRRGGEPRNP